MPDLKIEYMNIEELIPYVNNPRKNDRAVDKVAGSISEFGFKNPIIIDKDNVIVAGHTRLLSARKLELKEVPVIRAGDLTDAQIKAFRIADNKTSEFAEWDEELLSIELEALKELDFNLDETGFDIKELGDLDDLDEVESYSLKERYIVNPFSILDARLGDWQNSKRAWMDIGIKSELGRKENLTNAPKCDDYVQGNCTHVAPSTSIFDPFLTEICYKWFNVEGGSIMDTFAGGSVRGIVAEKLGYKYTGIDLSSKQIEANNENAKELNVKPLWICDDSLNLDKHIKDNSMDMLFSCPPYADLEVYSDDKRDLSNMKYDNFIKIYSDIIAKTYDKLKEDRFAVFVVGEVRNKTGNYYNFVGDTIKAFIEAGYSYYNELILVNPNGTAGMRADRTFRSRKVVKTHQNVLVFYKGDNKNIKSNYNHIKTDFEEVI